MAEDIGSIDSIDNLLKPVKTVLLLPESGQDPSYTLVDFGERRVEFKGPLQLDQRLARLLFSLIDFSQANKRERSLIVKR